MTGARDALTGRFVAWSEWLARGLADEELDALRDEQFVKRLEADLDRILAPQKRGPKPRAADETPEIPGLFQ